MKVFKATVWYRSAAAEAVGEPFGKGRVYKRPAESVEMFKAVIMDELTRHVDDEVQFGPISSAQMLSPGEVTQPSPHTVRNKCIGYDQAGCTRNGRPSCAAKECLFGLEKCPQGNHFKPIGERCGFQHDRRFLPERRTSDRHAKGGDRRDGQRRKS